MIKKFFGKFRLFWIIYFSLLFLCSLGGIFIPIDNDIIWIWACLFYLPFLLCLVYIYGFIMGIWAQSKLKGTADEIFHLSGIYFILVSVLLMVGIMKGILKNGILYDINHRFYIALGSALLFAAGAFIAKLKQRFSKQ